MAKGSQMRGCPYFATKTALVDADLVFAPYNYLVDPHIRESMRIDLTDCIVVFDEAHNIQVCVLSVTPPLPRALTCGMRPMHVVHRTAVARAPLWSCPTPSSRAASTS